MFVARFIGGPLHNQYMDLQTLDLTVTVKMRDDSDNIPDDVLFPTKKGIYIRVGDPDRNVIDRPGDPFDYAWDGWRE